MSLSQEQFDKRQEYELVQFKRKQEREAALTQLSKQRNGPNTHVRKLWTAVDAMLAHAELDTENGTDSARYSAGLTFREVLAAAAVELIEAEKPKPAEPAKPAKKA